MQELADFDLKGAPYGYTPFCDSRKEMDGFRFWKSGYWASHLAGRKYHIRYAFSETSLMFQQYSIYISSSCSILTCLFMIINEFLFIRWTPFTSFGLQDYPDSVQNILVKSTITKKQHANNFRSAPTLWIRIVWSCLSSLWLQSFKETRADKITVKLEHHHTVVRNYKLFMNYYSWIIHETDWKLIYCKIHYSFNIFLESSRYLLLFKYALHDCYWIFEFDDVWLFFFFSWFLSLVLCTL